MKRTVLYATLLTGLCIALSIVTVTLSGCSTLARTLNIVNPSYSIRDVRPHVAIALPLSASSIDFDFTLGVDNPNSVGLRLDRVNFDVLVDDNPVLTSYSSDPQVSIPARGIGDVHLRTRVGYSNIRSIWEQIVGAVQGNRARYSLRGTAFYNTPVGQLQFPVTVYTSR
jgi:LEA14-like dessication related protein